MRDRAGQLHQLRAGRRAGAVQARLALRMLDVLLVHTVEPQHVEMHIEVECAAEALDQGHRAALRAGAPDTRLIRMPARDHAMHDPQASLRSPSSE